MGFVANKKNIPLNKIENEKDINNIIQKLIDLSPLKNLDKERKDILHSRIFEIPNNALTHSKSKEGIIGHGYYNNKNIFTFSIYDLGVGIPKNVRDYLKQDIDSIEAMKWAFKKGNTTQVTDYPRGLGFTLLEEFRKECGGTIIIITGDIMYRVDKDGKEKYTKLHKFIKGTLFTLKISV